MSLRIAHISDLHFFSFPKNFKGFLGRNGLGVLNHTLFRKKFFHSNLFGNLLDEILAQKVDEVWISGDLSVSGIEEEFITAKEELSKLYDAKVTIRVIPGNHDLRSNQKKVFASLFQDNQERPLVEKVSLNAYWDLISIDASHNGEKRDCGAITLEMEEELKRQIRSSEKRQIAILCHYPPPIAEGAQNRLVRGSALQDILSNSQKIALFAHGHTHRQTLFQLNQMIIANSGISRGTHGRYNIYTLEETQVRVELRQLKDLTKERILVQELGT